MRTIILLTLILAFAGCEKSDRMDLKPEISKADSVYKLKIVPKLTTKTNYK